MQASAQNVRFSGYEKETHQIPTVEQFVAARDFVGANILLHYLSETGSGGEHTVRDLWTAYCYFHSGDFSRARYTYCSLAEQSESLSTKREYLLFAACCKLYMGAVEEARDEALALPDGVLRNRLLFHASARLLNEDEVYKYHGTLQNVIEDYMALGAIHFLRQHFEQAIICFEQVAYQNSAFSAVHLSIACCCYYLGDYKRAERALQEYRYHAADTFSSVNLAAAIVFRLQSAKDAQDIFAALPADERTSLLPTYIHNRCLYSGMPAGEQVFYAMQNQLPEARFNLVKLLIMHREYQRAYEAVRCFEPAAAREFTLKAAAFVLWGYYAQDTKFLSYASAVYEMVTKSDSDEKSSFGRVCAFSASFLRGDFAYACALYEQIATETLRYCEVFELNCGLALAIEGKNEAAYELLARHIKSYFFTSVHKQWLARLLIRIHRADEALQLYDPYSEEKGSYIVLLNVIGNESFALGEFSISASAAEILLRIDEKEDYRIMYEAAKAGTALAAKGKTPALPHLIDEAAHK